MDVTRLGTRPIIDASTHPSIGANIQGPSLIAVPDWVAEPLGQFYLYFADHKGTYIRLAYADDIAGPWSVHPPGTLTLARSRFLTEPPEATGRQLDDLAAMYEDYLGSAELAHSLAYEASTPHIASPDVHVDHDSRRIIMYLHGLDGLGVQVSRAAVSTNGLDFEAQPEVLGPPYIRAFQYGGWTYTLSMPGRFARSRDPLSGFEPGPTLFEPKMRHCAVVVRGDTAHVLWTRVGDAPEAILHTPIDLSSDWTTWMMGDTTEVLRPKHDWEGADAPVEPSIRSVAPGHVNQLRDPAIFENGDDTYLLYAVAGEGGIAIARLDI